MRVLLEGLMPRLFPGVEFLCVAHEGKQDLHKSLARKLKAWSEPGVRFCIVRDNDSGDCIATRAQLIELCPTDRRERCIVRIACQELEAWYFGDSEALARAYGNAELTSISRKAAYRQPDAIVRPSVELLKVVPEFQKVSGARAMGRELGRENSSQSYQVFLSGIDRLIAELGSRRAAH